MRYDFDKIADRRGTDCIKHDACKEVFGNEDVLPLWIADSDFPVAPFIIEAIRKRVEHPVYGYTFHGKDFTNAVRNWVKRRNDWDVNPEWIGFSPGVVAGFSMGIQALSEPGDGVLIQPPVYPPFANMIRMNNRKIINNPLVWNGEKYEIDFNDFEQKVQQAKVFLMCNPHNPTGRVFTPDELQRMGDLCVKHNVYIVSDEIHSDLTYKPHQHIHIAALSEEIGKRTITIFAPSKTFNVAGLTSSVTIIQDESVRRRFTRQLDLAAASHGNIFGTVALMAAYEQGDEWLDAFMEQMKQNAEYINKTINERIPSVKVYMPESTFLLWLDFRGWGMDCDALCRCLIDAGLGLNSGKEFGEEGIGFMRINIATSMEVLQEAMSRLEKADKNRK